ncbi:DUF6417 family protein [Streptomyces rochei]
MRRARPGDLSQEGGPMSREADRLAKAIAVRIPSEN